MKIFNILNDKNLENIMIENIVNELNIDSNSNIDIKNTLKLLQNPRNLFTGKFEDKNHNIVILNLAILFIKENTKYTKFDILNYYINELWNNYFPKKINNKSFSIQNLINQMYYEEVSKVFSNCFKNTYNEFSKNELLYHVVYNKEISDKLSVKEIELVSYYYYFNKLNELIEGLYMSEEFTVSSKKDYSDQEFYDIFTATDKAIKDYFNSEVINDELEEELGFSSDTFRTLYIPRHFIKNENNSKVFKDNIVDANSLFVNDKNQLYIIVEMYKIKVSLHKFYNDLEQITSVFNLLENDIMPYNLCDNKIMHLYNFSRLFPKKHINHSLCILFTIYLNGNFKKVRLLMSKLFNFTGKDNNRFAPIKEQKDFERFRISFEKVLNYIKDYMD